MPSTATQRSASRKATKRSQPYDQQTKARASTSFVTAGSPVTSSAVPALSETQSAPTIPSTANTSAGPSTSSVSCAARIIPTTREICRRVVQKKFPSYIPRNDWELLTLSGRNYKGDESGICGHLDAVLVSRVKEFGSHERVMDNATRIMDERVECTGTKPDGVGDPDVFVAAIPDSEYSIRLFPGSLRNSEYCLDFINSRTGEPVNSPFKFDLICIPDPNAPIGSGPVYRMRPLECAFGIEADKIGPGLEKFLFRDGQHCVLRRPGLRDVRFTIPIRRRPEAVLPAPDAHFIHFPQYIDYHD